MRPDFPKLEEFDRLIYWWFRTRDLIATAYEYSYPAYRESYRRLRAETRDAEIALLGALFMFDNV
jgi:hypothetical protein